MSKQHAALKSREIPIRRVQVNDPSQLPADYAQTPGGTLFSTTPGGTKIIYERKFLMKMQHSPLAKSPPPNLPEIPGVTSPAAAGDYPRENGLPKKIPESDEGAEGRMTDEPSQFQMDI
ncbi:eukaryotic translation initiation factor 4E-binding protein 1-like [Tubulanus polymorphus]|uniref:eukaryotic translation initiation factor 4E-binding protein 1-like n=1 Tax=Tubulanus polymorphus TaxID=672921 RepID=UPI003DA31E6E